MSACARHRTHLNSTLLCSGCSLKGIEDAKNKGFKGEQLQVMCHAPVSLQPTLQWPWRGACCAGSRAHLGVISDTVPYKAAGSCLLKLA